MKRVALFLLLLSAHAVFFERRFASGSHARLDALAPRARQVEQAIAHDRFEDALPIALELGSAHPDEPIVALWLASIYRGLGRPADEVDAWERFIALGRAAAEACPGLAEAQRLVGDRKKEIGAYERCAQLDPEEPERFIDLGDALERTGQLEGALASYRRAQEIDPTHPIARRRIEHLSGQGVPR